MTACIRSIIRNLICLSMLGSNAVISAAPKDMQAIVQTGLGGPEVLKLRSVLVLEPGKNQVLIRVYAAAVNPLDWKGRIGYSGGASTAATQVTTPTDFVERIPGTDVAGVIEKLGPGVTTLNVGQPVFSRVARQGVAGLNGGYAEYVVVAAANVVSMPKKLSFAQAAGLGTAALTGARAMTQANVGKGQRVLILGIAGGVGSSAAQVAKARGAYVIGTASARHNDYLKSIGVDEVIDYSRVDFAERVRNVDFVLDTVGGENTTRAIKTLKKGGMLVTLVWAADPAACKAAAVQCPSGRGNGPGAAATYTEAELLGQVAQLADAGKFTVNIDESFPLAKAGDAQEYSRDGHAEGKVIIIVDAAKANGFAVSQASLTASQATQNKQGTWSDCSSCPEMVTIPAGSFAMGGRRNITIKQAFAVAKTETTFAQWDACITDGGCEFVPEDGDWGRGNRPVMGVSWEDLQQYVGWLTRKTGQPYRLLSEAEWEYAARAGTTTAYFWGDSDTDICQYASVDKGGDACGRVRPVNVGSGKPNAWGLYDMAGGMWEWVADCWNDNLGSVPRNGAAQATGQSMSDCRWRVMRGGSWNFTPDYARADFRTFSAPSIRYDSYGFRVARAL